MEVTTGIDGKSSFGYEPTMVVRLGHTITATVTDLNGGTSEFSVPKTVARR